MALTGECTHEHDDADDATQFVHGDDDQIVPIGAAGLFDPFVAPRVSLARRRGWLLSASAPVARFGAVSRWWESVGEETARTKTVSHRKSGDPGQERVGAIGYAVFGQKLIAILDSWQREIAAKLPAEGTLGPLDLPAPVLLIEGGLLLVALVMTVMALVLLTSFLISRYGSRAVLRQASARPVGREQEPDLVRIVENLCIGTGLPLPSIHLVESPAPNAFATGNDPQHATLVVTRGLLTLWNRRELEGVIGHELSHIGNHDIRLNTVLAALVGTMTLPFRMCEALFRPAFRLHWTVGACATWMAVTLPC